jgi:hypothetical protein
MFVDGKLATISITYGTMGLYDTTALQALTEKFGDPVKVNSPVYQVGNAYLWRPPGAIIGLQPRMCTIQTTTPPTQAADDAEALVAGSYCPLGNSSLGPYCRVFYVDESAVPALRRRVAESIAAVQRRANGDL